MSIDPELLKILVCPEDHTELKEADQGIIETLNQRIEKGEVKNHGGESVSEPIESGLIRADGLRLYPIRKGIPIMLIDDSIDLG